MVCAFRLREAVREENPAPIGGEGSTVEIDETFLDARKRSERRRGYGHKEKVLSLVERDGKVRSFHVANISAKELLPIIKKNVKKGTTVYTD